MAYKNKADAIKYNNNFIKGAYDRINLTVPKGEKEKIRLHAEAQGEKVNAFIQRAIKETMARDGKQVSSFFDKTKGVSNVDTP